MENSNVNIKKSKKALLFLALLLMVVPFYFLFDLMAPILTNDHDYPTWVSVAFAFGPKIIGILIYTMVIIKTKERNANIPIGLIVSFILLMYMSYKLFMSGGLDPIGDAIIFLLYLVIYYIMCIGVFIKCANSFNVNVALVFLLLISSLIIAYTINDYAKESKKNHEEFSKLRYSNDLKTAEDFKEELLERNIYGEPNRLITYDVSLSHKVSFNDSFEKASRAYTYDGYITNNENYVWRIYYINGKIYAKLAEYTETKLSYNVHEVGDFISEDKIIYTYNKYSDKYELVNLENSYCEEPDDEYYCRNYIIVDRIDSNTLDNYANSYFIENGINLSS